MRDSIPVVTLNRPGGRFPYGRVAAIGGNVAYSANVTGTE